MIPTRESKVQSRGLKQRERQVSLQEAEHEQNDFIPSLSATGFRGFTHSLWEKVLFQFKSKKWHAANSFFYIFMCATSLDLSVPSCSTAASLYFTEILFQKKKK